MRVQTEEWRRFITGVRMYKGKKRFFYNGDQLWDDDRNNIVIYDRDERESWEVIIVLPGVREITYNTFRNCTNVKIVIMADTVKRIERWAFEGCKSLMFVRLSRNIEYIGVRTLAYCKSLTSIYISESCREIGWGAFYGCKKLIILSVPQHTSLGNFLIDDSDLLSELNIPDLLSELNIPNHEKVNSWIKSINKEEEFELHLECASYGPSGEVICSILKEQGLSYFHEENKIGITAFQYLKANPFFEIEEQHLINKFVLGMIGETIT
ncbi:hypothetical protein CTEN210_13528 [Chaetoceros tenuissimus]|uniref:Leucine-rich repeat domain-containing protein n=1 Tax=Chaetoceros tenuissimus TaxID=426638 RepID=A0AAD3D3W2_9STRA|nr:hypothetical protein CTEN210_13528 [Chaetoceros tenuissimus]